MKMVITDDMIDGFNDILKDRDSLLRVKRNDYTGNSVYVVFREDELLNTEYHPINPSDKFHELLESFFKEQCGVEQLSYNNTKTSFWHFE